MSKTTANSTKSAKPRGKPWPKGVSGNPAGRPKDGESWAAIIATVGNMYRDDILDMVGRDNDLGIQIAMLPANVQMKYLVTARVFAALMFEPTSGLWKELMERAEGKVTDRLDLSNSDKSLQPDTMKPSEIAARVAALLKQGTNDTNGS